MFTLEELELMHKLVDEWIDKSADPNRVEELREKLQGEICLRTLGEGYEFLGSVGDVNIVSHKVV
jgi:hypothetical protein